MMFCFFARWRKIHARENVSWPFSKYNYMQKKCCFYSISTKHSVIYKERNEMRENKEIKMKNLVDEDI